MDASAEARGERGSVTFRVGLALLLVGVVWFGACAWWAFTTSYWAPFEFHRCDLEVFRAFTALLVLGTWASV